MANGNPPLLKPRASAFHFCISCGFLIPTKSIAVDCGGLLVVLLVRNLHFFTWAADSATHFWGRGDNFYRVNTARMKNFFCDIFPCYDTSTECPDTEWLCVCRILIVAVCLEGQKEQRKNFKLISWKENHVTEDEECKCQHYMPIRYKEWESRQAAQKVLLLHFLEGLWGMVWDWVEHGNVK